MALAKPVEMNVFDYYDLIKINNKFETKICSPEKTYLENLIK